MENDETERRQALIEIFYRTRLGTVEGIEFDLRHNLLDPADGRCGTCLALKVLEERAPMRMVVARACPLFDFHGMVILVMTTLERSRDMY
jgi:hypothetical protein